MSLIQKTMKEKEDSKTVILFWVRFTVCHPFMGYHIYPTPPLGQDMTQGQFSSGV